MARVNMFGREILFQITDPAFDGRMKDIESVFTEKLAEFVPLLLAPDNVVVKRIGGNEVRCKEIINFFKAYIDVFTGDEMPEPKSMLQATSEANNLASLSEAKDTYIAMMESVCGGDKPYINERVLDIEHCKMRDQGWLGFNDCKNIFYICMQFIGNPWVIKCRMPFIILGCCAYFPPPPTSTH